MPEPTVANSLGNRRTPIAVAALVQNGRVLLVHRHPHRANFPNCWDLPGGHLEAGESPEDAVRRECREELGIEIRTVATSFTAEADPMLEKHVFVATRWSGRPINAAPCEHDDLRWFRVNQLAGLVLTDPAGLPDLLAAISRVG